MTQGPATDEDESSRGDPALLGRTVAGKYKIEKFLGGGAMGAVYKARQSALEKNVAVKVMHRAIAVDPNFVGRFHREAKAASRLDHPNSMRVIDFGEEPDGLLYIAMEYVEGRDLYRVIHDDWPISNADISDIVMQALAAIAVAHEMGVIHRDLKPENLMILRAKNDEEKEAYLVKVCDFGIAKITEKDEDGGDRGKPGQKLTTQGLVVGTPEYMSPEQAKGEKLDCRSDIYSMGIILYQLLTGRTPFVADTALAVVLKHITEPPEAPAVHYEGVHKGLEAVCMRALAKDRNDRFQTARAMRSAIREALDGRPAAADSGATAAAALSSPRLGGPPDPGASSVAGAMTASHLTLLGTAAAAPEPKPSRVGIAVAVAAVALLAGFGVLAGPRLLEKSRGGPVTSETHVTPTAPVTATSPVTPKRPVIPVAKPVNTTTTEPTASSVPSDPKKHNAPAHAPPAVKAAAVESAVAVEPAPPPDPTPPVVAAPPPPPVVAPPPPPAPAFNAASCRATLGSVRGSGATSSKDLALNGTAAAWTQCAQRSLTERPAGPISAVVHVMFSDNRSFRGASCPSCPPPIASCIASTTQRTVSVSFKGGDVTGEPAFDVPVTIVCE